MRARKPDTLKKKTEKHRFICRTASKMGNNIKRIVQCSTDNQLKAAESALEGVKDEAQAYRQRIAQLEAKMHRVRVAQLEKLLKKERDGKSPKANEGDEEQGESKLGLITSEIDSLKLKEAAAGSSSNHPRVDQQRSALEAYTKAEVEAVCRYVAPSCWNQSHHRLEKFTARTVQNRIPSLYMDTTLFMKSKSKTDLLKRLTETHPYWQCLLAWDWDIRLFQHTDRNAKG